MKIFKKLFNLLFVITVCCGFSHGGGAPQPLPSQFQFGITLAGFDLEFPQPPQLDEMTYVTSRITKFIRLPIGWAHDNPFQGAQGIQLTPFAALNANYLTTLKVILDNATSLNAKVMIDLHNFGQGPGLSGQITITQITSVGTLATVTYSAVSGAPLVNGVTVDIQGAQATDSNGNPSPYRFYNGSLFTISNVTPTTFQYTMTSAPGVSPATAGPSGGTIVSQELADVGSTRLPYTAFTDLWTKISTWLTANIASGTVVAYEPMNEWSRPDTTVAFNAGQAVTTALRAIGDNKKLALDGNHFSSAWDWLDNNNDNLKNIIDSANNFAIAPHGYFDYDGSGRFMCYAFNLAQPGDAPPGLQTNPLIGVQRGQLQYAPWALANSLGTYWGEFASSSDNLASGCADNYPAWNAILDNWMSYVKAKNWTVFWWGNGSEFGPNYAFNLSPSSVSNASARDFSGLGVQPPQQVVIDRYIGYTGQQPVGYRVEQPNTVTRETITVGVPSALYDVRYGGLIASPIIINPFANYVSGIGSAGGTFDPVVLPAGENALQYFTYTSANPGKQVLGATNSGPLNDVAPTAVVFSRETPAPASAITFPLTGANLSGLQDAGSIDPVSQGAPLGGAYRTSYSNYYFFRGFNSDRLPFNRSRIQPRLFGAIDNSINVNGGAHGLDSLDSAVNDATQSGMTAIIDVHDFGTSVITVDISSVSVTGTTATCTVADTTILNAGAVLTLGGSGGTPIPNTLPQGALTIVNSTTFTMPVPSGTPSSGTTTGSFSANLGTAGYPIAAYTDFMGKLATRYAGYPKAIIDLMNEPAHITAATMATAAQGAVTTIRAAGFTGPIMYEVGGSFSNAELFSTTLNSVGSFLTDPLNLIIYQVHKYLDAGNNGSSPNPGPPPGQGRVSLIDATEYARANGLKLFLGEFGISTVAGMITEVSAQLDYITANQDVWSPGWSAWTTVPYVLLPPQIGPPTFTYPPPGGTVTDLVQLQTLMNHSFSSFYAPPPTGINMNWVPGFDGGFIPVASSVGTLLTGALTGIIANIDGQGASNFALISNPGSMFSIDGSKRLVLQHALTDHTTYPITIQITTSKGQSAVFPVNVICESITTINPASVDTSVYTLSNGNLTILHTGATTSIAKAYITKSRSGGPPVYFEMHFDSGFTSGDQPLLITRLFGPSTAAPGPNPPGNYYLTAANISGSTASAAIGSNVQGTVASITYATSRPNAGDTVRVYWDPTLKKLGLAKNGGNWNNNVANDPTVGYLDMSSLPQELFISYGAFQNGEGVTFNFGATTFAFTKPAGAGLL